MKTKSRARSAPKPLRAIQTSRHLHVAARRHTGHVLPKRHTSYPVLTMIVLCVGVLLGSWTRFVTADTASYAVQASVPGPAPTVPASIDSPSNGSHFTATPITVTGSCPLNTYVMLLRNGFSSGVAICNATGSYQIITDLFVGTNQLIARDFSFTDVAGPDSAVATVYYAPPGHSVSGGSHVTTTPYNPTTSSGGAEPLLLKASFTLLGYYVGDTASWQVRIEGGSAPYAISADWGDGSRHLYSRAEAGNLSLSHVYHQAGGYKGSYTVKITASDSDGNQTVLQLVAIVSARSKTVSSGAGNLSAGGNNGLFGGRDIGRLVGYSWSGYGILLLMLGSFWLGERRELGLLRASRKRRA